MPVTEADLALNWAQHARDDVRALIRKIEELEKRIAQLEAAQPSVQADELPPCPECKCGGGHLSTCSLGNARRR